MPTLRVACIVALIGSLSGLAACTQQEIPADGEALLAQMFERYDGIHPYSVTIVQETVRHLPGGRTDTSTWYEAVEPGRMRIDFGDLEDGNGAHYLNGWLYVYKNGERVDVRKDVNPFLTLLHDVFHQPATATAQTLTELTYDLSTIRSDEWDGRPVWVSGASKDDESSAQFWIDQESLRALRIIQPVGEGAAVLDAHVGDYTKTDAYDQEHAIMIYVDGDLVQEERYLSVQPVESFSPALFDTSAWRQSVPYWQ